MRRRSRPREIPRNQRVATLAAAGIFAQVAVADCLVGADATGLEVGPQTLHVTLINGPPNTVLTPLSCEAVSAKVNPGAGGGGTGVSELTANHAGYSLNTGAITGGDTSGNATASALGAVRYVFSIDSLPGYGGPAVVDVKVLALVDAGGSISVSGQGEAAGIYNTSATLKKADESIGAVALFGTSGAFSSASATLLMSIQSVDIDTDYEIQFSHNQNVRATSSVAPMSGAIGSASSSGTTRISFDVQIEPQFHSTSLAVNWPMVSFFSVPSPALGSPPPLPSELENAVQIPVMITFTMVLLSVLITATGLIMTRGARGQ